MDKIKILHGNVFDKIKELNENSIDCVVTSPPYWGLRDYGTGTWIGGDKNCPHKRLTKISKDTKTGHAGMFKKGNVVGDAIYKKYCPECGAKRKDEQLGLEETYQEHIKNIVNLFEEIKPKLKESATIWLNYGDSYSNGKRTSTTNQTLRGNKNYGVTRTPVQEGIKEKDLVMIPNRIAIALQDAGWYIRSEIIWHKPNPMPESVKDRCTKAHEYIFLLSKNVKYYFDNEAIKEDAKYPQGPNSSHAIRKGVGDPKMKTRGGLHKIGALAKKNKRSVWTVTTKPFKGAHFATFPKDLIEPCVLAGCPEKMCCECGTPYKRQMQKTGEFQRRWSKTIATAEGSPHEGQSSMQNIYEDLGLQKQCDCKTNETKAGTVLDPFGGSGTTGIVAAQHNRNAVLLELNQEYIDLAKERINKELGIFGQGVQDD